MRKIFSHDRTLPISGIFKMPDARRPPNAPADGALTMYIPSRKTNSSFYTICSSRMRSKAAFLLSNAK